MRMVVVMVSVLLVTSCGVFSDREPDWPKVQTQANAWRIEVNGMVDAIAPLKPLVEIACAALGDSSTDCQMLRAAWATARAGTDAAHAAIDVYEATGAGAERVDRAVARAESSVEVVEAAFDRLKEVVNGMAQHGDQTRAPGARPPEQGTATAADAGTGEAATPAPAGRAE